jgi:hypothetical protein
VALDSRDQSATEEVERWISQDWTHATKAGKASSTIVYQIYKYGTLEAVPKAAFCILNGCAAQHSGHMCKI